jgi:hypothetical protein
MPVSAEATAKEDSLGVKDALSFKSVYDPEKKRVNVSGTLGGEFFESYRDWKIVAYAVPPGASVTQISENPDVKPLAEVTASINVELSFKIDSLVDLYSRYAIFLRSPEGELKLTTEYDGKQVDTSFVFIFGPSGFVNPGTGKIPTQYAFNGSDNSSDTEYKNGRAATADIRVEGGSGVKPVIKAEGIKRILNEELQKRGLNAKEVVINKATVIMPYDVNRQWDKLDKFPTILSPTVKLHGKDDYGETYVSYAGLTDASIESENQGDINRSLSLYSPDISHHVQEILKLDETAEDYEENLSKYDIWMLIMHEEVTVTSSSGSSYDDYYNSLLYNSYYNNMMYDPYGYGYGYGGYGYGYGGYGYDSYGYSNYYNYMMMASYMNSGSTSTESVSVDLDKDRYYDCSLGGPENANEELRPRLKLTFSAPKTAHVTE